MKKILLWSLLCFGAIAAQTAESTKKSSPSSARFSSPTISSTGTVVFSPVVNNAFWEGETLNFNIKYEFIGAGTAVMSVRAGEPFEARPTLHIETKASSNKTVDKFFKVRDFNVATVDRESMISRGFHQNLREGKYAVVRTTSFDYRNRQYKFERTRKGNTRVSTGTINVPVMDVLGAFFYSRTLPLHPGDEIRLSAFSDGEVYPLLIKVGDRIETIKVPAGKFQCIKIEPTIVGDAIFKASDGKMKIWMTNDEYHMPVLIRSKVFIGSFDAELQSYERPAKPSFDTSESK